MNKNQQQQQQQLTFLFQILGIDYMYRKRITQD